MAKSATTEPKVAPAPETAMRSLANIQATGFGSLSWLGTAWLETMSDIGSEWLTFVAARVREDVKTQHQLLHAKSLGDIQHIQAQFLQKAMNDYHDETGRMVEFCSKAMSEIEARARNGKDAGSPAG